MPVWGYLVVRSKGGVYTAPSNGQQYPILEVLNRVGQQGGELVLALPEGPGAIDFVFKFPAHAPQEVF